MSKCDFPAELWKETVQILSLEIWEFLENIDILYVYLMNKRC